MRQANRRFGLQSWVYMVWAMVLVLGIALQTLSYRLTLDGTEAFVIEQTFLGQPFNGQLVGRLYTPKNVATPYPTMILCHGVSSTKETVALWAEALAKQGIAAIIFDFRGYGESVIGQETENFSQRTITDLNTMVAFVRSQPQKFDLKRIGVGGHSMGGAVALAVANQDPAIAATVLLGMMGDATPSRPNDLFVGLGLFEELNPVSTVQAMLQAATDQGIQPGQTVGNFQQGTARRLVVSPAADHLVEPYDFLLIHEAVDWSKQSFGVNSPHRPVIAPLTMGISLVIWVVSLGISIAALMVVMGKTALKKHQRLLPLAAIASKLSSV
jgi:dienelactone hydrolase